MTTDSFVTELYYIILGVLIEPFQSTSLSISRYQSLWQVGHVGREL